MALLTKQENKHFHVFPIAFGQIWPQNPQNFPKLETFAK
jgi:hypothetical protein